MTFSPLTPLPPPPASNSPLSPSSDAVPMSMAGDHYISRAQCLVTLLCPRCFAPPTPPFASNSPPLPPTSSRCVRKVTITYHGLNVYCQSTDRSSEILSHCYNSFKASHIHELIAFIRHFHIIHNALCLRPKILH